MRSPSRDLRPIGPLTMIDRAIGLVRESFVEVALPAWSGGTLLATVILGIYYVERVEGIQTLRLPFALLLVLAWWARALLLGQASRRASSRLWDARPKEGAGSAVDVLRTSMVVGLGLWIWSWLLVAGSLGGLIGLLAVLPLFVLRGAIAPSWIARAACEPEAGFRAFFRAAADTHGRRFAGVLIEAMLLAGGLGLAVNLYAATAVAILLARSFAGLEIASVESFLSPGNTFVLLCVSALAVVILEPLRAAISALAYVDARVREEGLDLRAAIEDAVGHSTRRGSSARAGNAARAAAVLVALLSIVTAPAIAQPPPAPFPPPPLEVRADPESTDPSSSPPIDALLPSDPGPMPAVDLTSEDHEVDARVGVILDRPEFREFADHRGEGLRNLIDRLFEWLLRPRDDMGRLDAPNLGALALPGAWFFLSVGGALLLLVIAYLWFTRRRERSDANHASAAVTTTDPRERPPSAFLDDAARLAEGGELREALRALYLATLVALDRRRLIAFDPHLTNWQYLRQMPLGEEHDAFAQFTRLFDYKWYGHEATTRHDYERCRTLAGDIVGGDSQPEAAP